MQGGQNPGLIPRYGVAPGQAAFRQDAVRQSGTATMVPLLDLQGAPPVPSGPPPLPPPQIAAAAAAAMPPPGLPTGPHISGAGPQQAHQFVQQALQQTLGDPILSILLQDPGFSAAVKKQDVGQAALTASKLIKQNLQAIIGRVKPQHPMAAFIGPQFMAPHHSHMTPPLPLGATQKRVSDSDLRAAGGKRISDATAGMPLSTVGSLDAAGRIREIRVGDCVVIHNTNKTTDPELRGQEAVVVKVEANGWVEIQIPKLAGRTTKMQQRYLTLKSTVTAATGGRPRAQSLSGALEGPAGHGHGHKRASVSGAIDTGYEDGGHHRPYKRHHGLEGAVRPAMSLDQLLPAKVAPLIGRGVSKMKEVVRSVRKDMLSLEESVPWNGVTAEWKTKRPTWRRQLKNMENNTRQAESMVPLMASSMCELHEALMTDKSQGLFTRRGAWETRLAELADGGNNSACLQQLWDEMHEGVKLWHGTAAASGGAAPDKGVQMAAFRAFAALDAASERGDQFINQVPLDRILGANRESFAALRHLVDREKQHVMQRMDCISRGELLHMSGGDEDAQALAHHQLLAAAAGLSTPFGDYGAKSGLFMSVGLRSDLQLIHTVESEVDTDEDKGAEATDMDDSDLE